MYDIFSHIPNLEDAKSFLTGKFASLFNQKHAYSQEDRAYTKTRGILIRKSDVEGATIDLNKGYRFQFNPNEVHDSKSTKYETRSYTGLSYNDYIWINGGERVISFKLFLDNTPQSKTAYFRPNEYGSTQAKSITGFVKSGAIEFSQEGKAYSTTRVNERGILDEVEKIQSFLYPDVLVGEVTPKFASGGVVSQNQFRPPAIALLALGPLYFEGVVKSANVTHTLFDEDLTPIRANVDIEFGALEIANLNRPNSI